MLHRWVPLLFLGCASAGSEITPPDSGKPPVDSPDSPPPDALEIPLDSPPMNLCPSTATCQAAVQLGTVSGDTNNLKLSAMGHQAAWFRVRVTEDDEDVPGLALRMSAKLTSPASNDYDVFVYLNAGSDVVECTTTTGTKTITGAEKLDRAEWGEGFVPNGLDDDRDVSIEVRPVGVNCSAAAPWQLEIEGNWL